LRLTSAAPPEFRSFCYPERTACNDRFAGKHCEDWVKAYNERKAAGEKNIGLQPEALE
jgi:hypothetical protein